MTKRYDVVALGELLVDMINTGESGSGNPVFEANPGGAPCNVLAMLQKLGKRQLLSGRSEMTLLAKGSAARSFPAGSTTADSA